MKNSISNVVSLVTVKHVGRVTGAHVGRVTGERLAQFQFTGENIGQVTS